MRFRNKRRQLTYQKTLLAVYFLAGTDGVCTASNKAIGQAAGLSPDTVRSYLWDLHRDGTIRLLGLPEGFNWRMIVIADHPDAANAVDRIQRQYIEPEREMRRVLAGQREP